MSGKKPPLSVRIDDKLRTSLKELQKRTGLNPSDLARLTLWKEAFLDLTSPYTANHSSHFVMVTSDGDVYYRALHELFLNAKRERLPAGISMKPEKRKFYLKKSHGNLEDIKDVWMMNHFAAWLGTDTESPPLKVHVDRLGITKKLADLKISQPKDEVLTRETAVAFREYVQHREAKDTQDDRGDIPIDIPTQIFDLQAIVDTNLYRGSEFHKSAKIGVEIRNRESAVVRTIAPGSPESLTPVDQMAFVSDRYPGQNYDAETHKEIKRSFKAFATRFSYLAEETTLDQDGAPVVDNDETRQKLQSLELPKEFLFGRLTWPTPYMGFEVCLTWNKPD